MTVRFSIVKGFLLTAVSLGLCAGCGKTEAKKPAATGGGETQQGTDDIDPHDVPITDEQKQQLRKETAQFADAVERIKQFRDTIQEETKDGIPKNPYQAHQALDRVDLVLQWLPGIARQSNIPKQQWETINTSAQELRESFEKIHQNIDDKANPDFPSVKDAVEQAIGRLASAAESQPAGR